MLHKASDLVYCRLDASEGPVGYITDFLFDDQGWAIRYLVVYTGDWPEGRRILMPPQDVVWRDLHHHKVPVKPTREHLAASGEPAEASWPAGMYPFATFAPPFGPHSIPPAETAAPVDRHLHSLADVVGFHVDAQDGSIGHVRDLVWEDRDGAIHLLVVDTSTWLPGRQVVIAPTRIKALRGADAAVAVDLPRDTIKESPKYYPDQPVAHDYEKRLACFYREINV